MITVTLTTDILQVFPANTSPNTKRWVVIQNQGTTKVGLKFDGVSGDEAPLSSDNCFVLQPLGTAGDTLALTSSAPFGTEAENYIEAVGFTGGETLNIQSGLYNNRG